MKWCELAHRCASSEGVGVVKLTLHDVHFPSGAYDKEHEGIFGSRIGVQKPKIQASEGLMLLGTKM